MNENLLPLPAAQEHNTFIASAEDTAKQTVGFSALYHAADVEWVGTILAGNHLVEKYGLNPWLAAGGFAGAVGFTEYKLSNFAVRLFEKKDDIERGGGIAGKGLRELGGAAYAAFAGSANGVKINDSLGLESTPRRRKVQAGIFGAAVGLWVTPLPYFDDGAENAKEIVQDAFDNPKNFALYSAISIGSILGASKIWKESRKAISRQWTRHNERKAAAAKAPNNRRIY